MAEILVVILDCDILAWSASAKSLADFINSLLFYLNAFIAINSNQLIVYANNECIYNSITHQSYAFNTIIRESIVNLIQQQSIIKSGSPKLYLVGALSKALCVLNRQSLHHRQATRMIVFQQVKDDATQYNTVMNAIFSAQKLNVKIDSIVLGASESTFLQQASYLTDGLYYRVKGQTNLLQLLLTHFLTSRTMFKHFNKSTVDFRAACTCHQKLVEFAYMCSTCLALHCTDTMDRCVSCDATSSRKKQRLEE